MNRLATWEQQVATDGRAWPMVGVLGGMGPAATADFYAKLVLATPADRDQDHLRALIWSDPTVPDRTEALVGGGASPLPALLRGVDLLEAAGIELLAVPCNTAHAYLREIEERASIPVLNMVTATVEHLASSAPQVSKVGILATTGTLVSGLYEEALAAVGLTALAPVASIQEHHVTRAVGLVKAGDPTAARHALQPALDHLRGLGAERIIAACTEVPLILGHDPEVVDSTSCLAHAVVTAATSHRDVLQREGSP